QDISSPSTSVAAAPSAGSIRCRMTTRRPTSDGRSDIEWTSVADGDTGTAILGPGALRPLMGTKEETLVTYSITEPCVDLKDLACVEECPVDCIYEGERMLYIHPDECVDCGACEPVCPVEAIFYEDDVPEQWKDYNQANAEFFDDLGSPGGASKLGKIDKDHPLVAALPPQEHDGH